LIHGSLYGGDDNTLVSEDEIKHVAKLMKIEITDHKEYVEKIHKMLEYFDVLDSANVDDEEITTNEISLEMLRKDEHIPFNEPLIKQLKNYKQTYIRAPKMMV
jgi:aspartyl-tRNA(Asn)/glutamyl-tRNA(Gln) amidotransferase subunit C